MAKLEKSLRRERKRQKRKTGMQVDGKSVFTIQEELIKRRNGKHKRKPYGND